jgi:PAS domain S-box-containing protein
LDGAGNLSDFNEAFRALLGLKRTRAASGSFSACVERGSLAEFLRHLRGCRLDGNVSAASISLQSQKGSAIPVRLHTRMFRGEGQTGYHIVIIDDAERMAAHELEQCARERKAQLQWTVSELESFSYTLSHNMRSPIRAIQGYAELVAEAVTDSASDETKAYLGRIMSSARRLDALIQDVLRYSSLGQATVEIGPVDLNDLVRSIAEEPPDLGAPRAKIEIAGRLLPVMGHEGFLTQCVSNLLSNAIKFVAPGVKPRVRIWTETQGAFVQLWVSDNGVGIAQQDQARIFKVFERCQHPREIDGTGIGLAIVRRAAERMSGSAGVESQPGQGSKFWIKLRRLRP